MISLAIFSPPYFCLRVSGPLDKNGSCGFLVPPPRRGGMSSGMLVKPITKVKRIRFSRLWPSQCTTILFRGVFGPLAKTSFRKPGSPPGGGSSSGEFEKLKISQSSTDIIFRRHWPVNNPNIWRGVFEPFAKANCAELWFPSPPGGNQVSEN